MTRTPKTSTVRTGWLRGHPFPNTTSPDERGAEFDRWYQEEIRQVKEQALEETADHISKPYTLWHGDGGVRVREGLNDPTQGTKLTDWLRQQAQNLKGQA